MVAKIFGWILLISGVAIIGWTLYSSYNIFTGKAVVPEIFKMPVEETEAPAAKGGIPTTPTEIQEVMGKMIGEQLKGFLPVDTLPKLLDLAIWSMLTFILISGGGHISSLGIKLLKK